MNERMSCGTALEETRSHLTHRITAIWMRKTNGISYFDRVPMIKVMFAVRIVIRQPERFAAPRHSGEGGGNVDPGPSVLHASDRLP